MLKDLINKAIRCIRELSSFLGQSRWGVNGGIEIMMESRRKIKQREDAQRLKKQQLGIKERPGKKVH